MDDKLIQNNSKKLIRLIKSYIFTLQNLCNNILLSELSSILLNCLFANTLDQGCDVMGQTQWSPYERPMSIFFRIDRFLPCKVVNI